MRALIVLTLSLLATAAEAGQVRFPYVEKIKGHGVLLEQDLNVENRKSVLSEKERALQKKMGLKDKASLWVKKDSQVVLAISAQNKLILNADTRLEIPHIGWENGEVTEARLLSGSLRWVCQRDCELKVNTKISIHPFSQGDFLLEYDDSSATVSLTVIQGSASFSGMDNEVSLNLSAGEKGIFQGVLEDKEPAFDLLLQGRKVAKGKLMPVEKIDVSPFVKALGQIKEAVKVKVKPKKEVLTGNQICSGPPAEFQQCVWLCERPTGVKLAKNKISECDLCIRMRCDANGQWSDRTELASSENKCRSTAAVAACDY